MLPQNTKMEKMKVGSIPLIHICPERITQGAMVYYHGWESSAEASIFRGGIFASYGFDTYLVDAKGHGQRQCPDIPVTEDISWMTLMEIVQENKKEFEAIRKSIDQETIYVSGHSMGALTVGLILKTYPIKGGLAFNGSFDFRKLLDFYGVDEEDRAKVESPMDDLQAFQGKILYMGNGGQDQSIPAKDQEAFYQVLKTSGHTRSHFTLFEDVGHVVTTNMMDDGLNFIING